MGSSLRQHRDVTARSSPHPWGKGNKGKSSKVLKLRTLQEGPHRTGTQISEEGCCLAGLSSLREGMEAGSERPAYCWNQWSLPGWTPAMAMPKGTTRSKSPLSLLEWSFQMSVTDLTGKGEVCRYWALASQSKARKSGIKSQWQCTSPGLSHIFKGFEYT